MKLGALLRDWRDMNRMTLRDAAKEIGVSTPTLSRIEHDQGMDGKTLATIFVWMTKENK